MINVILFAVFFKSSINIYFQQVLVDGLHNIKRQTTHINDEFWPMRILRSLGQGVTSWTSGLVNMFRRHSSSPSNTLETLYRPEKWMMDDPYGRRIDTNIHENSFIGPKARSMNIGVKEYVLIKISVLIE